MLCHIESCSVAIRAVSHIWLVLTKKQSKKVALETEHFLNMLLIMNDNRDLDIIIMLEGGASRGLKKPNQISALFLKRWQLDPAAGCCEGLTRQEPQ